MDFGTLADAYRSCRSYRDDLVESFRYRSQSENVVRDFVIGWRRIWYKPPYFKLEKGSFDKSASRRNVSLFLVTPATGCYVKPDGTQELIDRKIVESVIVDSSLPLSLIHGRIDYDSCIFARMTLDAVDPESRIVSYRYRGEHSQEDELIATFDSNDCVIRRVERIHSEKGYHIDADYKRWILDSTITEYRFAEMSVKIDDDVFRTSFS